LPLEKLTNFENIFRLRLKFVMATCGIKNVQLTREYAIQYHEDLSEALVSRWLSGERKVSPRHYVRVKTLLAGHLKAANSPLEFGLEQEMWEWDGLVLDDKQLDQNENRPCPVLIGNMLRYQPGVGHFYRKSIRDDILQQLINPDPQSGLFQPGVVALTGLPGSGKSEMLLEVLERANRFFSGGILFADLRNSSRTIWQTWDGKMQRCTNPACTWDDIERRIRLRQGRWLLVLENVQDGQKIQSILPAGRFWVLATTHGIAALQPIGWEQHAFPLASLNEQETTSWLKGRMGGQWDESQDITHASELLKLSEGLPMAVAILASLVRSRGWQSVLDALRDEQRAVPYIRYNSGQETPTSSLARAIDMAFHALSPAEKTVLREIALYAPGSPVPEVIFYNLTHEHQDVVPALVEKGLLNRYENQRLRTTVLRLHRLVALHARNRLLLGDGRLLARMVDFSAFFQASLPDELMTEADVFDRLYEQRKLLSHANEFWQQVADEAGRGKFEPDPKLIVPLNTCLRTAAYFIWMNFGSQAALARLNSVWEMLIVNFPEKDLALPETRRLWADILGGLGDMGRVARNGVKITRLMHTQLYWMVRAGKAGNVEGLLSACQETLLMELIPPKNESQLLHFLWISRSLRILFRTLWDRQRYEDLLLITEQTLPFFLALPWCAGLEALWWNFKATLAARGQAAAARKVGAFRETELLLQDALGQADLSFSLLAEVLIKPGLPIEMILQLRNLEGIFKSRSLPEIEGITFLLIQQIESGQLNIQAERQAPIPSNDASAWLEIWPEAMAQFKADHGG
jgi:hypothetical protein